MSATHAAINKRAQWRGYFSHTSKDVDRFANRKIEHFLKKYIPQYSNCTLLLKHFPHELYLRLKHFPQGNTPLSFIVWDNTYLQKVYIIYGLAHLLQETFFPGNIFPTNHTVMSTLNFEIHFNYLNSLKGLLVGTITNLPLYHNTGTERNRSDIITKGVFPAETKIPAFWAISVYQNLLRQKNRINAIHGLSGE